MDGEPWWENGKFCPAEYSKTNGLRFFQMFLEYPDKFFFFSIGQDVVMADDENTWFDLFAVIE